MSAARLRLRAEAPADFDVIAACLQDALMPLAEMTFQPHARRFVAVFDRFMWERCAPAPVRHPARMVQSALRIEGVTAARLRGIDRDDQGLLLELLTLVPEADGLSLLFAGGGEIRLEGEGLVCLMEDMEAPRAAPLAPDHAEDDRS